MRAFKIDLTQDKELKQGCLSSPVVVGAMYTELNSGAGICMANASCANCSLETCCPYEK